MNIQLENQKKIIIEQKMLELDFLFFSDAANFSLQDQLGGALFNVFFDSDSDADSELKAETKAYIYYNAEFEADYESRAQEIIAFKKRWHAKKAIILKDSRVLGRYASYLTRGLLNVNPRKSWKEDDNFGPEWEAKQLALELEGYSPNYEFKEIFERLDKENELNAAREEEYSAQDPMKFEIRKKLREMFADLLKENEEASFLVGVTFGVMMLNKYLSAYITQKINAALNAVGIISISRKEELEAFIENEAYKILLYDLFQNYLSSLNENLDFIFTLLSITKGKK